VAKKGGSRHVKRYAASRALKLPRKSHVWTTKAAPGPHTIEVSAPLRSVIRDYLSGGRTAREVDSILSQGNVLVDGKVRREPSFPVGLMDIVQLPSLNQNYRVTLDHKRRLILVKIDPAEASVKLCRVTKKQIVRGKKVQLTFHDGKTIVGDLKEFRPGDVAKLALPDLNVLERLPFEVGATALITGGNNVSKIGRIAEIRLIAGTQPNIVILKEDEETFQAPEHYVFVIGREKPSVSIQGM
jgi:small subunit ribosomal protein S4e